MRRRGAIAFRIRSGQADVIQLDQMVANQLPPEAVSPLARGVGFQLGQKEVSQLGLAVDNQLLPVAVRL